MIPSSFLELDPKMICSMLGSKSLMKLMEFNQMKHLETKQLMKLFQRTSKINPHLSILHPQQSTPSTKTIMSIQWLQILQRQTNHQLLVIPHLKTQLNNKLKLHKQQRILLKTSQWKLQQQQSRNHQLSQPKIDMKHQLSNQSRNKSKKN